MKRVDSRAVTFLKTAVKKSEKNTAQSRPLAAKKSAPKSPFNKITYKRNAEVYKILAHPIRLEILNILKSEERSVEELLSVIEVSKANMSQHLSLLRYAGVVTTRKQGLNVVYSIVDARIVEPCGILRELRRDPR